MPLSPDQIRAIEEQRRLMAPYGLLTGLGISPPSEFGAPPQQEPISLPGEVTSPSLFLDLPEMLQNLLPAKLPLAIGLATIKPIAKAASGITKKLTSLFSKKELVYPVPEYGNVVLEAAHFVNKYGNLVSQGPGARMAAGMRPGHHGSVEWLGNRLKLSTDEVLDATKMASYRSELGNVYIFAPSGSIDEIVPGLIKRIAADNEDPLIKQVILDIGKYPREVEKSFSGTPPDAIKWLRGLLNKPAAEPTPTTAATSGITRKLVDLFSKKQLISTTPEEATFINQYGASITTNWGKHIRSKYNEGEHIGVMHWLSDRLNIPIRDVLKETKMATYRRHPREGSNLVDVSIHIPLSAKDEMIPGVIKRLSNDVKDPTINKIIVDVGDVYNVVDDVGIVSPNYVDFEPGTLKSFSGSPTDTIKWLREILNKPVSPTGAVATKEVSERFIDLFSKKQLVNTIPEEALLINKFGIPITASHNIGTKVGDVGRWSHDDLLRDMEKKLGTTFENILKEGKLAIYRMQQHPDPSRGRIIYVVAESDIKDEMIPGIIRRLADDSMDPSVTGAIISIGDLYKGSKTAHDQTNVKYFDGSIFDAIKWLRGLLSKDATQAKPQVKPSIPDVYGYTPLEKIPERMKELGWPPKVSKVDIINRFRELRDAAMSGPPGYTGARGTATITDWYKAFVKDQYKGISEEDLDIVSHVAIAEGKPAMRKIASMLGYKQNIPPNVLSTFEKVAGHKINPTYSAALNMTNEEYAFSQLYDLDPAWEPVMADIFNRAAIAQGLTISPELLLDNLLKPGPWKKILEEAIRQGRPKR